MSVSKFLTIFSMAAIVPSAFAQSPDAITIDQRYARAEALIDEKLEPLVLNETVSPNWTGDRSEFWYRRQTSEGGEYLIVKPNGEVRAAFDHVRLAQAAGNAASTQLAPQSLTVTKMESQKTAELRHANKLISCNLEDYSCMASEPKAIDSRHLLSPDGRMSVFTKDHNIWIRDIAAGRDTQLTQDGEKNFSWGKFPDTAFLGIQQQKTGLPFKPWGFSWSPDGRKLIAGRVDDRAVAPYPFIESVPQDGSFRPKTWTIRAPLLGEKPGVFSASIFDLVTGKNVPLKLPGGDGSANFIEILGWSKNSEHFYTGGIGSKGQGGGLYEVDVLTGALRTVISEEAQGFGGSNSSIYNLSNIRLINNARQLIWFSQRDGWGHLYRYDVRTGRLLNRLTRGSWLVRDIIHVDEARQRVYFTAGGREAGNPYLRRLYRVNFDGSGFKLLTPEVADHSIEGQPIALLSSLFGVSAPTTPVSPDGRVFIDTYSTIENAPVTLLRSTENGAVITTLEEADNRALLATGWKPPEAFKVKAADGVTDLYGVIYWPSYPVSGKLPVIDALYGGPQEPIVPHNYKRARVGGASHARSATAELGFAVVTIDGRATPKRSRAFHDIGFGNFADIALADHVAAIRQIGQRYPQMDLDRVGVYGHSFGGYVSARAMLKYPDFYKVAVSSAGSQNYQGMYGGVAAYLPAPDYDGSRFRPSGSAVPDVYREMDNATLAHNLKGKLLLTYGDLDENAYPAVTFQFIDALIKADRSYDLLYLPNRTHAITRDPYFIRKKWDYFVEHLMKITPPSDPLAQALP